MFLSLLPIFLLSILSFYWFLRLLYCILRKLVFCVSDFCCRVTNYHELSGLKQHNVIIWQFLWVRSLVTAYLVLCFKASPGYSLDTGWGCGLIRSWTENEFLSSLGLLAEFISLWLQDWGSSFLPEAPTCSCRPPHFLAMWAFPAWPLTAWLLIPSRPMERVFSSTTASKTES